MRGSHPHRTLGLTSRAQEKLHTPEVSHCVIPLWTRYRHHTSGHRTTWFFPAQVLGLLRSYLSQPAWFICYLESTSHFLRSKHRNPAQSGPSPGASGRVFTPAKSPVHLAVLHGSAVPSHKAGIRARLPAWHGASAQRMLLL